MRVGDRQSLVAVVMCLLLSISSLVAKDGFGVKYDGESIANLKIGTEIRINPSGTTITLMKEKEDLISIPARPVNAAQAVQQQAAAGMRPDGDSGVQLPLPDKALG